MNLYYAMGGGLGHLTRARAFLQMLEIEAETAIITASNFADDKRVVGDVKIIHIDEEYSQNKKDYQKLLANIFDEIKPKTLFLDAFPVGIIGEFADFDFGEIKAHYLARLIRWENYSPLLEGFSNKFEKTYILEELKNEHLTFIKNNSKSNENFELIYPQIEHKIPNQEKPFWLIVHSGENAETMELVNYAEEMREIESAEVKLILMSPQKLNLKIPDFIQKDIYPASRLFESAERIFTACGYNVMKQTKFFRDKHFFIPFERRFDDQFKRAARIKQN